MMKSLSIYKLFSILAGLLILIPGMQGAIVYHVTNSAMGSSGSIDIILNQAIIDANSGQQVNILFNATGLCQITSSLPAITITNGSITLERDPLALVEQGIQFASTVTNSNIQAGLAIFNTSTGTAILIKNLTIRDFVFNPNLITRVGIQLSTCYHVTIENCKLENNYCSVAYRRTTNLLIKNNKFINNGAEGAIELSEYQGATGSYSSSIMNNHFYVTSSNTQDSRSGIEIWLTANHQMNHSIEIRNNIIEGYQSGIQVQNISNLLSVDNTFQVTIAGNTVKSIFTNLFFVSPYRHFKVVDNILGITAANGINIDITTPVGVLTNNYGFDLVNPNSSLYPVNNTNNTFSGGSFPNYISIRTTGNYGKGIFIVGQNLPGRVTVIQGKHIILRENKIASNGMADLPIDLVVGNQDIAKPQLSSIASNGSSVAISYILNGNQHVNSYTDFLVEFYKSNATGDLVNYIGNQTITSLTGGTYTANLSLPQGVNVSTGDRIAATVTALGNRNLPNNPLGTSEVAYMLSLFCPTCQPMDFITEGLLCKSEPLNFINTSDSCSGNPSFLWNFGDGSALTSSGTHTYATAGTYVVKLIIAGSPRCPELSISKSITISDCKQPCTNCIGSFAPDPGKYLISAWVKDEITNPNKLTYSNPQIYIDFPSTSSPSSSVTSPSVGPFIGGGAIIDEWQRIEQQFQVPSTALYINLRLACVSGNCLFDDIRIFPKDGSMKSYVYDPLTLRLVAELDERNYATLYEYDEDGKLTRVKKETELGKMTIKANFDSTVKKVQ